MAVFKRDMVDINLETGNIHRSFLKHSIGLADNEADHFGIRVFRDGVPVDLTGVSVQGYFRNPQGTNIAITSGNIVSGNEAEVVLPQACYAYEGQFCLAIKLVGGGVTGTIRIVDGMVDNANTGSVVAPTETVPTYQEVLAVYAEMVECIDDFEDYKDQIDGELDEVNSPYPIKEKFEAFGWNAVEINGHCFDEIEKAFNEAKACKGKPTCIVAKCVKGKGVSYMENQCGWHGAAPNAEQFEIAMNELNAALKELEA